MGTLYIVSTPIGNLSDITIHAIDILFSVPVIVCEDTRVTGKLFTLLKERYARYLPEQDVSHTFISYTDNNEENALPTIISILNEGSDVALVSDAGTPLISDPGYRLVSYARTHAIPVIVIGGMTACIQALVGSGYPTDRFEFLGFLPEKHGKRIALLESLKQQNAVKTYITYVSSHKINTLLDDMSECYGLHQRVCITKELTKVHEHYWYGTVSEAQEYVKHPQGEYVLLFRLA